MANDVKSCTFFPKKKAKSAEFITILNLRESRGYKISSNRNNSYMYKVEISSSIDISQ